MILELKKKPSPNLGLIDINVKIGLSAYGSEHSAQQCLQEMDQFRIQKSIVSCFTPPDLSFENGNRTIEQFVLDNPSRFYGAVRIDPRFRGSKKLLRNFLRKRSFICVSLNPFEQAFKIGDPLVKDTLEIAEEFDVPVMVESGFPIVSLPLQVAEVAKEFKKVRFIMSHSGQLLASGQTESDALNTLLENRNVYSDTSLIILSGLGGFVEQVVRANENDSRTRLMFGSDSPMGNISVELLRIDKANIREEERRLIFSENARKLFRI